MRDHMRPMPNQADAKIYESEQRENTKRHSPKSGRKCRRVRTGWLIGQKTEGSLLDKDVQ